MSAETIVVAYQGGEGAYSHLAARRHFESRGVAARFVGFPSFSTMLAALEAAEVEYAVLPIENSIAGSINESYDLLAAHDFSLVGEEVQPIQHCLIGIKDIPVEELRYIYSHPVALAQCGAFLETLNDCHVEAFRDTALAVAKIKEDNDPRHAAIASEDAAQLYDLPILRRDIADHNQNYTRMVIVAREAQPCPSGAVSKTSLMFSTAHEQGALARCICAFSDQGLNLSKLESRPKRDTPFEYVFYLDVEGNTADPSMQRALQELGAATSYLKILGSYPV